MTRAGGIGLLRLLSTGALGLLALYAIQAQFAVLGAVGDRVFGGVVYHGLLALAAALCLGRAVLWRHERGAWSLIGAGIALTFVGDVVWTSAFAADPAPPYPSVADAFWLAAYPLSFAGVMLLVRARLREAFRVGFWVDAGVGATAVAACAAALVFPAVLEATAGSPAQIATNLAYPSFDLLLLGVAAGMAMAGGHRASRSWALLAAGFAVTGLADCLYLVQDANGTYAQHTLLDPLWPLGAVLLARAALDTRPDAAIRPTPGQLVALPSAFGAIAAVLLAVDHWHRLTDVAVALALACLLLGALRLAQLVRENLAMLAASRAEALSDALTGLGNRRRLMADLEVALETRRPHVLALFDLDGFKRYNDAHGHPAGDALLARLGSRLDACTGRRTRAYRMGGDEFCVLFEPADAAPEETVAAAEAALSDSSEGFAIAPSTGVAWLPSEAATASEALQLADQRMYADKRRGAAEATAR